MKNIKNLSVLFIAAALMLATFSCKNGAQKKNVKEVSILYPNWAEGIAMSYLAKVALEANGYKVELTNLEPGLIYGELSKKNSKGDVFLDAWLPNTHKDYWAKYGATIEQLGVSFIDGTTGLVVPSYVSINSIEEMNKHAEEFDGKIIGVGSGAGIHANTLKAIEQYGLTDFEQITSSGPAMVASLEKAIKKNEWIVITGWKPHFKWAENDLKYLDDPKGIYPKDECQIISRKGFKEEKPVAANFFANFNFKEAQLYELMGDIKKLGEEEGAKSFYTNNKAMIDSWLTK